MTDTDFSKATEWPGIPKTLSPQHLRELADGLANANAEAERICEAIVVAMKAYDPERERKVEALVEAGQKTLDALDGRVHSHDALKALANLRGTIASLKGGENG